MPPSSQVSGGQVTGQPPHALEQGEASPTGKLVGAQAWAAAAAAVPEPLPYKASRSTKPSLAPPSRLPIGRNLVNQGGSAAGGNSDIVTGAFGNFQLALKILNQRGITKIKCHICKLLRELEHFSNRQLLNYKESIYSEYAPSGRCTKKTASCKDCINGVVTHLDCMICGITKPLSKFMKTQRRNPDRARCKRCVQCHLETERTGEVEDPDAYESDDSDDDDTDDDVDFPIGFEKYANGSKLKPEDEDDDDDGKMANALEKMGINSNTKPVTSEASDSMNDSPGCDKESATPVSSTTAISPLNEEWKQVKTASKQGRYTYGSSYLSTATDSPITHAGSTLDSSTPSNKSNRKGGWGPKVKAAKPEQLAEVLNLWAPSSTAINNGWNQHGGQVRLFKKKQGKGKFHGSDSDNNGEDDGEEM